MAPKRKARGFTGTFNDDDAEFELSGILDHSTQTVNQKLTRIPTIGASKRILAPQLVKSESLQVDDELLKVLGEPDAKEEKQDSSARKQGASVHMDSFTRHFDEIQCAIMFTKADHTGGRPCSCGRSSKPIYKCFECFELHPMCAKCIVSAHKHLPFHPLYRWNGRFFNRESSKDMGVTIYLGHSGSRCPNRGSSSVGQPFVIVHTNGIHELNVEFCFCHGAPQEHIQLVHARLFPATIEQPSTVFTFAVLKEFHVHTLTSKKSSYDYIDALIKLTNPAFPQNVPNRYQEFNRAFRVWQHLASKRRSGQSHDIDSQFANRRPSSLAVRCPACPEVGVNLDKDVLRDADESEKHKYTLFISADGNFRLQLKKKNGDPDDIALNNGNAYFVEDEAYKTYVAEVGQKEDAGVCSHLKAVRLQNIVKFRNAVVSGVIAIQCARHGFFMPQGVADLRKGEGYAFTDYVLVHSLADQQPQRWIMLSYDIWCSYHINLEKRVGEYFKALAHMVAKGKLRGAVPKMHCKNHVVECQRQWAFNYLKCSGDTCGEVIETSWSENNQTAGSTKEMNEGARHDILDGNFGYWNFMKMVRLGMALLRAYTRCLEALRTYETDFSAYHNRFPVETTMQWAQMSDEVVKKADGTIISPFEPMLKYKRVTQSSVYERLLEKERVDLLAGCSEMGLSVFINTGLRIELDQLRLRDLAKKQTTEREKEILVIERRKLWIYLSEWRSTQFKLFRGLQKLLKPSTPSLPELEALLLPSQLDQPTRAQFQLEKASEIEYQLREGQAYDALEEIRTSIQVFNHNLQFKMNYVHGQRPNTRAQGVINSIVNERNQAATVYRIAYKALRELGLAKDDGGLRELRDEDMYSKNMSAPAKLGDSKRRDPWIWKVGKPSNLTETEDRKWSREMDRVKWFRDRATRDRAREEKEILEEEIRRTVASHKFTSAAWLVVADGLEAPGFNAYAYKQAELFGLLAKDCEGYQKEMEKLSKEYRQWFAKNVTYK